MSVIATLARRSKEDRGSLPLVMLLSLVSASLGALLVPTLISQNNSARNDVRTVHALHAAQTGIDVALGQVRAASTGGSATATPIGVLSVLPCNPLTGSADASATATYQVSIAYYSADPVGQSATLRLANYLSCTPGRGTATVPRYALLTSAGSDTYAGSTSTRTIESTYVFHTTNENIAGGPIKIGSYCLDAGTDPHDGSAITMQTCSPGLAQQKFAYTPDLTLQLANSSAPLDPHGLCLDGTDSHDLSKGTVPVWFQPCQDSSYYAKAGQTKFDIPPLYRQQWGFFGNSFLGSLPPNGPTQGDGTCINAQTLNFAGSPLVMGPCGGSAVATIDPSVGAGRAGLATQQYVDFKQFGRCLDVESEDVSRPLISYPCKQVPFGLTNRDWNQAWAYDPVRLTMTTYQLDKNPYCLKSPITTKSLVTVAPCVAAAAVVPKEFQWTQHIGKSFDYFTQATIQDANGKCLTPDVTLGGAPLNASLVTIDTCNGTTIQKWNADPNILAPSPLQNTGEK